MPNMDKFRDKVLSEPAGLIGYVQGSLRSSKTTELRSDVIKHLFNHAGRPAPQEIQENNEAYIALPRKELASLMLATAKKAGYGPLDRAAIYLRTRF